MALSVLTVARTLPSAVVGGMEEVAWNLTKSLSRLGIRETILTTSFDSEAHVIRRDGVTIHEIPYVPRRLRVKPSYRWWPYFGAAAALYAREAGLSGDVVHSQSFYADGFLAWREHPPVVLTAHGTPMGDYLGARDNLVREVGPLHPRLALQRIAFALGTARVRTQLRKADAIVAVSRTVAQELPGLQRNDPRVAIIPNGIDPADFPAVSRSAAREELRLPAEGTVLSFVGRVEEAKGVGALLDVVARLPDAVLLIAGGGVSIEAFRARLHTHPAGPRVRILGTMREGRRFVYAASDLFCLPSRHEGAPVTLLEAMAMGTPVATTRPWLPDALLPYASVNPDPLRMVEEGLALSKMVHREELRAQVLTHFTWDRIAKTYSELFHRLLEGPA